MVLYSGSFDPVTKGHIDTILRLKNMFDKVVVLVSDSLRKKYLFSSEERVRFIIDALGEKNKNHIRVVSNDGLTSDFAKKNKIQILARSIRSVSDWDHELALSLANKKLVPNLETVFIAASPEFGMISSSLVKEIAMNNGRVSDFVTKNVEKKLMQKLRSL
jgi:pantetheine-phosphate adenylyltransferase